MLIDTHCHVNIMVKEKFDTPLNEKNFEEATKIAEEANQAGVNHIINVGTSVIESLNCINLAQRNDHMYAAIGIHPSDCTQTWQQELKEIEKLIEDKTDNKIVAIGECGIDLHHQQHNLESQKELFKAQIELSLKHKLPLSIHMRDATETVFSVLEAYAKEDLKGVIHCFSEDQKFADYVIKLGFVIGIGGAITYPNNGRLRSVVSNIPLKKIILETDAPYLPPQVIRGKENHPKHIADIAKYIANLKKQSFGFVAEITTNTAFEVFKLSDFA